MGHVACRSLPWQGLNSAGEIKLIWLHAFSNSAYANATGTVVYQYILISNGPTMNKIWTKMWVAASFAIYANSCQTASF